MKKIFFFLLILAIALSAHAQDWKTVTLMDKVTTSLPGTPVTDESKGIPMQKVVLDDSAEITAGVMDYSKFGLGEATLQALAGSGNLKTQIEAGVATQPGVKLLSGEEGKYDNKYFTYDMTLEVEKDGKKKIVNVRNIFYKQYGITVTYIPGQKGENADVKNKAFNAVKISE